MRCNLARMSQAKIDRLHYVRLPNAQGGRAEMVRLCYVLAGRRFENVFWDLSEARERAAQHNPFKQFPFIETADGRTLYQTLAIMHHASEGTSMWPSGPALTRALAVAMGAYDLYQAFGGFLATDLAAKQKFEEKQAPKYFVGLEGMYAESAFATGEGPSFADCIAHEAIDWCVRRNEASRALFEQSSALKAFVERFRALPAVQEFRAAQAAARQVDNTV